MLGAVRIIYRAAEPMGTHRDVLNLAAKLSSRGIRFPSELVQPLYGKLETADVDGALSAVLVIQ